MRCLIKLFKRHKYSFEFMARIKLKKVFLVIVAVCSIILISTHLYLSNSRSLINKIGNQNHSEMKLLPKGLLNDHRLYQMPKSERPWFMTNGTIRPDPRDQLYSQLAIWPEESSDDRIINQLMYIPEDYYKIKKSGRLMKILITNGFKTWSLSGRDVFLRDQCPVDTCSITASMKEYQTADAVLFTSSSNVPKRKNITTQTWIYYLLESPLNSKNLDIIHNVINLMATYRHDSDIVTPYEKFVKYSDYNILKTRRRDYAKGKTKKVAWFVSNCKAKNERLKYALQLKKYIEVDIFGRCGPLSCSRSKAKECFQLISKEYKFYLSFENSNCEEYITEKFFLNGLQNDVIPIVMGGKPDDYRRVAPYHSYIHTSDFASPQHLAQFLLILDNNDTLYNSYFEWKSTGEFINTFFWCRLCALLHSKHTDKLYGNVGRWWHKPGVCGFRTNKISSSKRPTFALINYLFIFVTYKCMQLSAFNKRFI